MQKTLDVKLAKILSNPSCGDFILADAKDADMAGGMAAGRLEGSGEALSQFSFLHHEHRSKFNRYSSLSRCFWSSEDGR